MPQPRLEFEGAEAIDDDEGDVRVTGEALDEFIAAGGVDFRELGVVVVLRGVVQGLDGSGAAAGWFREGVLPLSGRLTIRWWEFGDSSGAEFSSIHNERSGSRVLNLPRLFLPCEILRVARGVSPPFGRGGFD